MSDSPSGRPPRVSVLLVAVSNARRELLATAHVHTSSNDEVGRAQSLERPAKTEGTRVDEADAREAVARIAAAGGCGKPQPARADCHQTATIVACRVGLCYELSINRRAILEETLGQGLT